MAQPYFSLMEAEQTYRTIQYARERGILLLIKEGPRTSAGIADRMGLAKNAVERLLQVLTALGYLNRDGSIYSWSDNLVKLEEDSSLGWAHLQKFMSDGQPWVASDTSLEALDAFYTAFFSSVPYFAQMSAPAASIARQVGGTPKNILDIGAGAGTWSFAMANVCEEARVTGLDLPNVIREHFLPTAELQGLANRVEAIEGDFHEVRIPENKFDRLVMGSSFHFLHAQQAVRTLTRFRNSLCEGGELIIIDHFADTTAEQRISRTMYEMRLAMRTTNAKNYSAPEIERFCEESGFLKTRHFDADGPGFLSVLVFVKE
ncbi:methyltransferase [Achromobacter spanius]|nr:methyltransferase [Achromobacter spanius]